MNSSERRYSIAVATLYGIRMFGLFMMLPVLAVLVNELPDASPTLVGLAVGAYGISQAILQIPLGMLSDRWGRRTIIAGGLLVFALGSVVAALAASIEMVVIGRLLQGAGAISAALTASLADHTRPEVRTRSMALVGAGIGLSFVLAMGVTPLLAPWLGLSGLFWFSAVLAVAALVYAWRHVRDIAERVPATVVRAQWLLAMRDGVLMRTNLGVLLLHGVLTACFVTLPPLLQGLLDLRFHGLLYLGTMLLSLVAALPMIFASDRRQPRRELLTVAFILLALSQLWLAASFPGLPAMVAVLTVFFAGFLFLEARLPALISQLAPPQARGAALGLFATSQFLGAFLGGWLGGWLGGVTDAETVFAACAVAGVLGAWFCRGIRPRETG